MPVMGPVRFYCDCKLNTVFLYIQVSQVRNTAFGAREGEGKSLPRGEGFRVRVTCTQRVRGVCNIRTIAHPQISASAQQV